MAKQNTIYTEQYDQYLLMAEVNLLIKQRDELEEDKRYEAETLYKVNQGMNVRMM